MNDAAACARALLIGAAFTVTIAYADRPWSIEDSFATRSLGDLQVSPDGDRLLFVVRGDDLGQNTRYSGIWVWTADAPRAAALTDARGSAFSPRWSPDGESIAYFARADGRLGLWTMAADGSGKKKLTDLERSNVYLQWGGPGNGLAWSPDGRTLAFSAAGPRVFPNDIDPPHLPTGNDVMVIDRLLHKGVYFYSDLRRTHIWTVGADGGQARQLTSGEFDYHSVSWSPDGEYIACASNRTGLDDYNSNNDVLLVSTRGDEVIQLTHTASPEYQTGWSPDGRWLAYQGRERSHRSKESDAELVKIYVLPAGGGEPIQMAKALDRWTEGFQWGADSAEIYFTAQNEGRVELYSASVEDGAVQAIVTDQGQVGDFSVADDGTIFYVYGDFTSPDEIYRMRPGERGEKLTRFNDAFAEDVEIVDAEHFRFASFDGLGIDGWVMRPAGFRERRKYPLVLNVHGGPHGQYGYRLSDYFQELAANGYAVLFMNPRGSTGRGQSFSDGVVGDVGGGDYQDLMTGLDYAIGRYEFIDAENMGVTGVSYGGYMTNWIITHTNRFKAAVSVSGIANLIAQWSEGANHLWYESDMELMPMDDYERAWDASPLKYIHGAATPTLFVNGRWDFITSLNQADAMFVALKKLGVDTQIALYPEDGHGIHNQPRHTADYHERSIAWFDKYLK